jgi:hypothetical protein
MFLVLGHSPEVANPGLPLRSIRSLGRIFSRRGGPSLLAAARARTSSASWLLLGGEFEDEESSWGESEGFSVGVGDDIDEDFFLSERVAGVCLLRKGPIWRELDLRVKDSTFGWQTETRQQRDRLSKPERR